MKKIFTLSIIGIFLSIQTIMAVEHVIQVSNFLFTPSNLTVNVGDVITWQNIAGSHNTTSLQVPNGAEPWASPINPITITFSYSVEVAGNYEYTCTFHAGHDGAFTAQNTVSVANLQSNIQTDLQVRFANNALTAAYDLSKSGVLDLKLFGLNGQLFSVLKSTSIASGSYIEQFELSNIPTGVYLVRMQTGGEIITKRVFVSQK